MKNKYIVRDADTDKYELTIPLNTKNKVRAIEKAEELINDLLSCISFTEKDKRFEDSPNFLKAIRKISKTLWRILK